MKYFRLMVLFLMILSIHVLAYATDSSNMRCGNDLVSVNDSYFKVINTCDKPCYEENLSESGNNTYSGKKVSYYCIDGYTYVLNFKDSKLKKIDSTNDKCKPCNKK